MSDENTEHSNPEKFSVRRVITDEETNEGWFEVNGKRLTDEEWEAFQAKEAAKSLEITREIFKKGEFEKVGPSQTRICENDHKWVIQRMSASDGQGGFVQYTEGSLSCLECGERAIRSHDNIDKKQDGEA